MAKNRDDLWAEAKLRCRLDEATLQMARGMGLNPRSLIKNIPSKSQRWKAPVKDWIREMYARRHGRAGRPTGANRPETPEEIQPRERRPNEDHRFTLRQYEHFRAAARYVASAFEGVPAVRRVALFGSVAAAPRRESSLGAEPQFTRIHEPKDVDIAVWIDGATDLDRLRVLRSRAVNRLWEDMEIGVAHHQVDVFLIDATTGSYLGRLCCFNQCPKHKAECQAVNCGTVAFLRQHDDFVFDVKALQPSRIQVLFDREQPGTDRGLDEIRDAQKRRWAAGGSSRRSIDGAIDS